MINKTYLDENFKLQPLLLKYYNNQKTKKKLYLSELQKKKQLNDSNCFYIIFDKINWVFTPL